MEDITEALDLGKLGLGEIFDKKVKESIIKKKFNGAKEDQKQEMIDGIKSEVTETKDIFNRTKNLIVEGNN